MNGEQKIKERIRKSIAVKERLCCGPELIRAIGFLTDTLKSGGRVLACGNGGSAEQAQHLIGELVGKFRHDTPSYAAIALGTNIAVVTALANDFGYESVFARELEGVSRKGDVLVAISTSGNSPNVVAAARAARERGVRTIGLLGRGGMLKDLVDIALTVDSESTARIQEAHLLLIHIMAEFVEEEMMTQSMNLV